MSKVKLNVYVKNDENVNDYNFVGIFDNNQNKVKYLDNEGITNVFDFNKNTLFRKNDTFELLLSFNNKNKSYYLLKENNMKLELDIVIKSIKYIDKKRTILYSLDGTSYFEFSIEIKN